MAGPDAEQLITAGGLRPEVDVLVRLWADVSPDLAERLAERLRAERAGVAQVEGQAGVVERERVAGIGAGPDTLLEQLENAALAGLGNQPIEELSALVDHFRAIIENIPVGCRLKHLLVV